LRKQIEQGLIEKSITNDSDIDSDLQKLVEKLYAKASELPNRIHPQSVI
jgi:hypothetical protein